MHQALTACSNHVAPKPARAPRLVHVGFEVLVSSSDVRSAAAPCFCGLIVAHVWFDHRADYTREGGTEEPVYAGRKLERAHVRGPLPVFVFQYPHEDVYGRPQDFLNAGSRHLCRVKGLSEKARDKGASMVEYLVWDAIVPWGRPSRVHYRLRE